MIQPTSTWAAQRALPPEGRLIPRVAVGLLILFPIGGLLPVPPTFKDRTQETGLNARLFSGSPSKKYILESMSGGVGLVDFNRDGWIDIYLVNGSSLEAEGGGENRVRNRLYRNNGNGTFQDVTQKAGVGDLGWGMGVCAGDVSNDGWEDLYVTNFGPNVLYVNRGDGTFRNASRESGTDLASWSSSAALADYDRDGDLDLYVSNYLDFDPFHPPADSPLCRYRGLQVQCGPHGLTPQADLLYENQGDGVFSIRNQSSGMGEVKPSYGMGVVWADYDDDGDLDLFVANDSMPNFLFRNQGDGTFREVALLAGVAVNEDGREQAGMGVDFADYDNDGDLDLVVTNFSDDTNALYANQGNGLFTDRTYAAGLGEISWQALGWGAAFVDLDLDGWKDLVIANGHVYPEVDRYEIGTSYHQKNFLFRNLANGRFEEVSSSAGSDFQRRYASRGLAVGDLDNNGQMDLLIANLDREPSLLINQGSPGNWLILRLESRLSNRSAIGARAWVHTEGMVQMAEIKSGGSYQSQSDLRLHFGLGAHRRVQELRIRWPSGSVQVLEDVEVNQILSLTESVQSPGN